MEGYNDKAAAQKRTSPGRFSLLLSAERGVGVIDTVLNYIGVSFVLLLMMMVVIQIVSRKAFRSPIVGYVDFMEMMMVLLVFFCLSYSQWQGGHIRVELFMIKVLKGGRRYHVVESLHLFLCLVAFSIISFHAMEGALFAREAGDATISIYMPTWPFKMGVAIGCFFLSLRFLVQMVQNINWAVAGKTRPELMGKEVEA